MTLERPPIDPRLESRVNYAPPLRLQDDPGLRFAVLAAAHLAGLLVVRMNLHGEAVVAIEELDQEWKVEAAPAPVALETLAPKRAAFCSATSRASVQPANGPSATVL